MLRKYAKYSIIILIQLMGIVTLTLCIAPYFLNHRNNLNQWHDFFDRFQGAFLVGHGLFYMALYCSWPHLIHFLAKRQDIPKQAMQARYYLIGTFLLFELLTLLR